MDPCHASEPTNERSSLQLATSETDTSADEMSVRDLDPFGDEMSVQDQILSSWYMAGATRSGQGVPTELEYWRYAA